MAYPPDFLTLFGEDEDAARAQAQALAEAMGRRRAAGTVASIIGGPFANAGRSFLGEAGATQNDLMQAGGVRAQQQARRQALLQDATQHRATLAQQAAAAAGAAQRHAEQMGIERQKLEQDAVGAIADPITGKIVFWNKKGTAPGMVPADGQPGEVGPDGKPKMPNVGKLTDAQAKSFNASLRIRTARQLMGDTGYNPAGLRGRVDALATGADKNVIGNLVPAEAASDLGQGYYTAGRNLVAALLRKESGAAITDDEWGSLGPLYIPMPWDKPETVAIKKKLMDVMEQSANAEAGPMSQEFLVAFAKSQLGEAATPQGVVPGTQQKKGPRVKVDAAGNVVP